MVNEMGLNDFLGHVAALCLDDCGREVALPAIINIYSGIERH